MTRWGIVLAATLVAALPAAAQQAAGGYRLDRPTPGAPAAPATKTAPVLRVPGPDWKATGMGSADADLAGDPDALPLVRPKPADQDSFMNSREWQDMTGPRGGHGRRSTLQQLGGVGEGMALDLAEIGLGKVTLGGN